MEETKVNQIDDGRVEVLVNVKETTWKDAQAKAFKKLAANVTIPGFRKGKAPENMIKGKIDQVKVMDEAINALLPVIYKDILDKENIKPFNQPKVDVTKLSDKELEIKFTITTLPKITLGEYKGLKIGKGEVSVTDKDVDNAIDALRVKNATVAVKDGTAAKGDIVVMDFVGKVNGVAFDGGTAENYELELGSGTFIPGFEDQLVGVKAGDKKDVNVKFPENYTPELKGKDATFECKVHEVKEKKLPELNEEFIADVKINDVKTVEDLRANQKERLTAQKTAEARRDYINKLIDAIAEKATISIPNEVVESQMNMHKKDLENRMQQSGLTLETYLQILGQKPEEFEAKLREDSKKEIAGYLVLEEVATVENLEVTDADLDFELAKIAEQYKMKVEDIRKNLGNQIEEYRHNIKMNRVEDLLYKNND
ncbi:MAG: trigger factor [Bacilli bacterium]|nr:trigger factor [Bacilli bacterium]